MKRTEKANMIPHFGRDEMNLPEFPLGPVTATASKTFEVDHVVRDRKTGKPVARRLLVTGSDAFGLPGPIDDQVIVGITTLTHEADLESREVFFSAYHLCRILGWATDGRAYRRLENCFDRLAATTLKFRDSWWDKGEQEYRTHTFHIIDNVTFCSRKQYAKERASSGRKEHALCSFTWNEVMWKSLRDGYIKKVDMAMFRRITGGRRREIPFRLWRILDKRLYKKNINRWDVQRLCVGTLGISAKYPSEMRRIIDRASRVLVDCGYLSDFRYSEGKNGAGHVTFAKKSLNTTLRRTATVQHKATAKETDNWEKAIEFWVSQFEEEHLAGAETSALAAKFGSAFERRTVCDERRKAKKIKDSSRVRKLYIRRFVEDTASSVPAPDENVAAVS